MPTHSRIIFDGRFARELPEMAVAWQADDAPSPRLLALNEPVAAELGFDPGFLRSPEGLALLLGTSVPDGATPVAQACITWEWVLVSRSANRAYRSVTSSVRWMMQETRPASSRTGRCSQLQARSTG